MIDNMYHLFPTSYGKLENHETICIINIIDLHSCSVPIFFSTHTHYMYIPYDTHTVYIWCGVCQS